MPRRAKGPRRRGLDVLTIEQEFELTCGPTRRGSAFASEAEAAEAWRLHRERLMSEFDECWGERYDTDSARRSIR